MPFVAQWEQRPEVDGFLRHHLGVDLTVTRVAGDASFRSYHRITTPTLTRILMDAPPDREDSAPFVDLSAFLDRHGIRVPRVLAAAPEHGLYLLDDLGDLTFLRALQAGAPPADRLYEAAVATLVNLQATPLDNTCVAHRRPYDRRLLAFELSLFTDWYVEGIRKTPIPPRDRQRFAAVFERLMAGILAQPVVLVHRDYHSRNLMWTADEQVGVIDFQDGVVGPVTYDLASLLRDCYIAWPAPFRQRMMDLWLDQAGDRLGYRPGPEAFQRDFDWMAVQRNLKAVGIFGRLSLRDGKHGYLHDIPRTLGYVRETLPRHPELADLAALIDQYAPREGD
ncbi:MAG: phosphotransferase [Magnetococcales bacterium]|nr:phosphotransferase [Magnetococcales bacterium]